MLSKIFPRKSCNAYFAAFHYFLQIPDEHLEGFQTFNRTNVEPAAIYFNNGTGIPEADIVIYVRSYNTPRCIDKVGDGCGDQIPLYFGSGIFSNALFWFQGTVAYAAYCQLDQFNRPVAGYANFCPTHLNSETFDAEKFYLVKHVLVGKSFSFKSIFLCCSCVYFCWSLWQILNCHVLVLFIVTKLWLLVVKRTELLCALIPSLFVYLVVSACMLLNAVMFYLHFQTVVHELFHILGFSQKLFDKFQVCSEAVPLEVCSYILIHCELTTWPAGCEGSASLSHCLYTCA